MKQQNTYDTKGHHDDMHHIKAQQRHIADRKITPHKAHDVFARSGNVG